MNLKSIVPDRVSMPAKMFLAATTFNGFGNGILNVVLLLYLTSLGFESGALGTILMMQPISTVFLTIPSGILADRYGAKKILFAILFPFGLTSVLLLTARTIEMFMFAYMVMGIVEASAGVILVPLYSSFFEAKDMDRAFGLQGFLNLITVSAGSLLGFVPPMLVSSYGYSLQAAYWVVLAIALAFFSAQMPFYMIAVWGMAKPKGRDEGFRFDLRSKSVVAKFSFINLISNIGYGTFFSLFAYYVNKKFGIQSDALGTLYFASNFIRAGASIIAPRLSQTMGTLKTIAVTLGLCTPFYMLIPMAPDFTWLSALYILRLFFGNLSSPLTGSLYMRLLYEDEKATANSITMMASYGGNIVAPKLGGQLMQQVSLDAPAYLGSSLYIFLAASYYLLLRNEKEKRD
ncbi:MAG: MFS transporter [Candidatus Bathyarchaeia archaeon]